MKDLGPMRGEDYVLAVFKCDCGMAMGIDTRCVPSAPGESLWMRCPNPECSALITMGVNDAASAKPVS